jgi:hypothetical protein
MEEDKLDKAERLNFLTIVKKKVHINIVIPDELVYVGVECLFHLIYHLIQLPRSLKIVIYVPIVIIYLLILNLLHVVINIVLFVLEKSSSKFYN